MNRILSYLTAALLTLSLTAGAVLMPDGAVYTPGLGTLIFSEDYGSDFDGQGSWTGTADVTVTTGSVQLSVASSSGKTAALDVPGFSVNGTYTIDLGIKSWTSDNGSGIYSAYWTFSGGNSYRYQAHFRTDNGGIVATGSTSTLPLLKGDVHVMRVTKSSTSSKSEIYADWGGPITMTNQWNGGGTLISLSTGGSPANSTVELAWIRVYNANSNFVAVPEPGTLAIGLAMLGLTAIRRRKYNK